MKEALQSEQQTGPRARRNWRGLITRTTAYKVVSVLAIVALVLQTGMFLLALFEPGLPYSIPKAPDELLDSERFVQTLAALTSGHLHRRNRVEVLTNGEAFYRAELQAIRAARRYIHVECYIFEPGRVTDRLMEALTERARAGVEVAVVVDAIGSGGTPNSRFRELHDAGGRVAWYHPVRWHTWPRINNRTHREIIVIDGTVGFVGGAGFADHWLIGSGNEPRWRDTMVRIEGDAVSGLEAVFAENWLESAGEILMSSAYFPFQPAGDSTALVVSSSPTTGRSTQARVLFQALVASARRWIHISSPYFLPDDSLTAEIARAVRERHVEVKILVPGKKIDHVLTRRSSRRRYGDLLRAGARIFEYQPSMTHTKSLIIDGQWSVVGSTNMDSRSFGLNDEVNLALLDPTIAQRLERDFQRDVAHSTEVHYEEWKHRDARERIQEWIGALLERQQ